MSQLRANKIYLRDWPSLLLVLYNPAISSTAVARNSTYNVIYGDNSTASGTVYSETVAFGELVVKDHLIGAATNISKVLLQGSFDGFVGLGLKGGSALNQSSLVGHAVEQGVVKDSTFGMKISGNESQLFLGGVDTSLFKGVIKYHAASGDVFWLPTNGPFHVGNRTIAIGQQSIIDSDTTNIYSPANQVAAFYATIPGAQVYDPDFGLWSVPCGAFPDGTVAFSWDGGRAWGMSQETLNIGGYLFAELDTARCVGAIASIHDGLPLPNNTWLLGDSFMRNVYTAFSIDKHAVGFAELK